MFGVGHVTKRFGSTVAVDDLSFDLGVGQIVALLGENGSGKSTIIGVLAGLFGQDFDGQLSIGGERYRPLDVAHAERNGIVVIAQEINVVPELTVAQTLFLNNEPTRWGLVDHLAMRQQAAEILDRFDVPIDAVQPIGSLDLASQQLVMIARALHKNARLLILDEPTAALTGDETDRLFERLRRYRARGTTSLFVSHRLAEVFAIADRILVLRDGALVGDHDTAATTRQRVVHEMLGASGAEQQDRRAPPTAGQSSKAVSRLRVEHLTAMSPMVAGRRVVDDVSFDVRGGEILGVFGLLGSGVGVIGPAVFGAWRGHVSGLIEVDGRPVVIRTPSDAIACGVGFVAQDRRDALVGIHSIATNMAMASLGGFERGALLDEARLRIAARERIAQLSVRAPDELARVGTLSGGNQQKVQVARWLIADTPILVLDDPTRGVDVGARGEIHVILAELAASGRALLLVSSDASELLAVCARIIVMRGGRIASELVAADTSERALIDIAAGNDAPTMHGVLAP